jgi:hypothetical protein
MLMNRVIACTLRALGFAVALAWYSPAGPRPARGGEEPAQDEVWFETRVAPLLAKHCPECRDPTSKKGGLDLSRRAAFAVDAIRA